jgi:anoctamin-10
MIYIAFIKFDIMTLKEYLISLYMVDEVRRLITESLIPSLGRSQKILIKLAGLFRGK